MSARSSAPALSPHPHTSSILQCGTRSIAGPSRGAITASACRRSTCRPTCVRTRRPSTTTVPGVTSRSTATCGTRAWPSAGGRTTTDAGSAYDRTGGHGLLPIPGAGRRITTAGGGIRRVVVLDSGPSMGSRLGVMGVHAELRQLVSARLERPPALFVREHQSELSPRPLLRSLVRVDGSAAAAFRRGVREHQRNCRQPARRTHPRIVRRARQGSRLA